MLRLKRNMCCGVVEIDGLSGARHPGPAVIRELANHMEAMDRAGGYYDGSYATVVPDHCAFVMFSEAKRGTYATRLANWIENQHLGTVHRLPRAKNMNTRHMINVFMWEVDHPALKRKIGNLSNGAH